MSTDLIKEIAHRIAERASHGAPQSLEEVIAEALVEYRLAKSEQDAALYFDCMTPERWKALEEGAQKRRFDGEGDSAPFNVTLREMECLLGSLRKFASKVKALSLRVGLGDNQNAAMQAQHQHGLGAQAGYLRNGFEGQ